MLWLRVTKEGPMDNTTTFTNDDIYKFICMLSLFADPKCKNLPFFRHALIKYSKPSPPPSLHTHTHAHTHLFQLIFINQIQKMTLVKDKPHVWFLILMKVFKTKLGILVMRAFNPTPGLLIFHVWERKKMLTQIFRNVFFMCANPISPIYKHKY